MVTDDGDIQCVNTHIAAGHHRCCNSANHSRSIRVRKANDSNPVSASSDKGETIFYQYFFRSLIKGERKRVNNIPFFAFWLFRQIITSNRLSALIHHEQGTPFITGINMWKIQPLPCDIQMLVCQSQIGRHHILRQIEVTQPMHRRRIGNIITLIADQTDPTGSIVMLDVILTGDSSRPTDTFTSYPLT